MSTTETLFVRTKAGRIHNAARVGDQVLTDESCNVDDAAGDTEVLTAIPADVAFEALCRRCFPVPPAEVDAGDQGVEP